MRFNILLLILALFLYGCTECNFPLIDSQKKFKLRDTSTTRNIAKVDFEGHSYIMLWANYTVEGQSFIHDPDCKCLISKMDRRE